MSLRGGGAADGFRDRADAGRRLAVLLRSYKESPDTVVLALPRGGVPVGFEVATALHVPFDALLVRKLGVPGQEELAMGAVALGGVRVLNDAVIRQLGLPVSVVDAVTTTQQQALEDRSRILRGNRPPPVVEGRTVIVVDDGIATGATVRAALSALRRQTPARLVVAVPVAPPVTVDELGPLADEVVSALMPDRFVAVGYWYRDFSPTSDDEVRALLDRAEHLRR